MEAVKHIPLEDREAFKYALAATLVKNNAHWRAFETVFEVYFSLRGREYTLGDDELDELLAAAEDEDGQAPEGDGRHARLRRRRRRAAPEELAEMLYQALLDGDDALMRALARQAVQALRRHGAGPSGRRHLLPLPHAAEPRPRRACSSG